MTDTKAVTCPVCRQVHVGRRHMGFVFIACPELQAELDGGAR